MVPAPSPPAGAHALLAAALLLGLQAAGPLLPAEARPARCRVIQSGRSLYAGPCDFQQFGGNGSFSVTPIGARSISGANPVTLTILAPGEGEVRGLTADGINSRWGAVRRSRSEPACWEGTDFRLCVD
ncbi:MAG: hypothetical protein ACOVNL_11130 [Prochlorococcaceae cyanobacterium]|jgi:hypothetical protein